MNDAKLAFDSALTKSQSIVETVMEHYTKNIENVSPALKRYIDENNLNYRDTMTYEHYLQLNEIANKVTINAMQELLTYTLTHVLYEAFTCSDFFHSNESKAE